MKLLIILIVQIAWILIDQASAQQQQFLTQLLEQWDLHVLQQDKQKSQQYYTQIKSSLQTTNNIDKSVMRSLFRIYGKYVLYGLDEDFNGHIDYTKVFYYEKQSADLGDSDALALIGVLGTFKLDGTFNIVANIESQAKLMRQFVNESSEIFYKYSRIESFAKYHHLSAPMVDLYFASLQGSDEASLIMAYKFMKGLGTDQNCSNSALFIQPILQKYFIDKPMKDKIIFQNRRIDHILYNTETFTLSAQWLDHEHIHIFEQVQQVTRDSITDVLTLAYNFLYGINGVKRNYEKAYELFSKIAQDTKNSQSMAFMAQMIVEGIAPNQDKDLAFRLFKDSAEQNDSKGLNGLGYMYLNGYGVEKNVKKALKNFLKSAEQGNADGHYNYGSLFMMPSTLEIDRNKRLAYTHLNVASAQGHALAQYALSLIFLDGVDFFYSCELAIKLMHQASSRLHTAHYVKQGNELFANNQYPQALANYLQAALLGYNSAIGYKSYFIKVNTAILADEFKAIRNQDIEYHNLNQKLSTDDLYKFALDHQLPLKQIKDPFGYVFQDYIQLMGQREGDLDYSTRYRLVHQLTDISQMIHKTIGSYVANKLFGYCKLDLDGYCYLRYGDFYYDGKSEEQNYLEAYNQYKIASEAPETPAVIQAHAYFNMGYIVALGLAQNDNHTLAREHFNNSLTKHPLLPGINADLVFELVQLFGLSNKGQFMDRFDLLFQKVISYSFQTLFDYHRCIMISLISCMIVVAYGAKLKAQNLMQ